MIKASGDFSSCPQSYSASSLSSRLSPNLDGVVIEFLFRQSKISEVLGGSGYNSDRLCLPYIPQLTGMNSGQGFQPTSAFPVRVRKCRQLNHLQWSLRSYSRAERHSRIYGEIPILMLLLLLLSLGSQKATGPRADNLAVEGWSIVLERAYMSYRTRNPFQDVCATYFFKNTLGKSLKIPKLLDYKIPAI